MYFLFGELQKDRNGISDELKPQKKSGQTNLYWHGMAWHGMVWSGLCWLGWMDLLDRRTEDGLVGIRMKKVHAFHFYERATQSVDADRIGMLYGSLI